MSDSDLHDRVTRLEGQYSDIHAELKENTATTKAVRDNTASIVDTFNALQGAFKVFEFVGKAAKPAVWIMGVATAVTFGLTHIKSAIAALLR